MRTNCPFDSPSAISMMTLSGASVSQLLLHREDEHRGGWASGKREQWQQPHRVYGSANHAQAHRAQFSETGFLNMDSWLWWLLRWRHGALQSVSSWSCCAALLAAQDGGNGAQRLWDVRVMSLVP